MRVEKTDDGRAEVWKELPGYCLRLGRSRSLREHEACSYCFGDRRAIQIGDRSGFCDFQPGRDPVSFGFPESHGRHLRV